MRFLEREINCCAKTGENRGGSGRRKDALTSSPPFTPGQNVFVGWLIPPLSLFRHLSVSKNEIEKSFPFISRRVCVAERGGGPGEKRKRKWFSSSRRRGLHTSVKKNGDRSREGKKERGNGLKFSFKEGEFFLIPFFCRKACLHASWRRSFFAK